jgi:hypothetical protein
MIGLFIQSNYSSKVNFSVLVLFELEAGAEKSTLKTGNTLKKRISSFFMIICFLRKLQNLKPINAKKTK